MSRKSFFRPAAKRRAAARASRSVHHRGATAGGLAPAVAGSSSSAFHRKLRFEPLEDRRLLALVTVTTDQDTVDFNDGLTSLREAIFATNLVEGADEIQFAPALTAAGPATILLTQGELAITDDLTITGPGAGLLTIDASGNDPTPDENNGDGSRIFTIDDGKRTGIFPFNPTIDVLIDGLTLTGGDVLGVAGAIFNREALTLTSSVVTGNHVAPMASQDRGGGIESDGILHLIDSQITGNSVNGNGGSGGGIASRGPTTISRSTIANNTSENVGGGIFSTSLVVVDSYIHENVAGPGGAGGVWAGFLQMSGTTVRNNRAIGPAGGVHLANGSIITSTVTGNVTTGTTAHGGGIVAISGGRGTVLIMESQIEQNRTTGVGAAGGGIYHGLLYGSGGRLQLERVTISGNAAAESGGGVFTESPRFQMTDCMIVGNAAVADGGGIFHSPQTNTVNVTPVISRSTIRENSAGGNGGGALLANSTIFDSTLAFNHAGTGGGIWTTGGEIVQSTVSQNSAGVGGGVVVNSSSIRHSTIAFNSSYFLGGGIFIVAGETVLDHAIVAKNSAPIGPDVTLLTGASLVPNYSLIGNNGDSGLIESPPDAANAAGNLIGGSSNNTVIDPGLVPLADNGGPTPTHALMPGSPAINAGDPAAIAGNNGIPAHDQRGAPFTRVYGGRIDIGAYEFQPPDVLLGDYNQNGKVDTGDYTVWRNMMGASVPAGAGADGNGDGLVDRQDYDLWKANYGSTVDDLAPSGVGEGGVVELVSGKVDSAAPPAAHAALTRPSHLQAASASISPTALQHLKTKTSLLPRPAFNAAEHDLALLGWLDQPRTSSLKTDLEVGAASRFTIDLEKPGQSQAVLDFAALDALDLAFASLGI